MIPATRPCLLIGHRKEGFDLRPCQKVDLLAVIPLRRQCEDALRQAAHLWFVEGHVAEKRMKGCQPDVATAGSIAAFLLQMIEEGAKKSGVSRSVIVIADGAFFKCRSAYARRRRKVSR